MFTKREVLTPILLILTATAFQGCSDDDDMTGPVITTETFTITIENVGSAFDFAHSGAFDTPVGESAPAPIGPGGAYEFHFGAAPGSKLSFATMFVHSNDLFYAPDGGGIELFAGDNSPLSGDVTSQISLWDAGTEMNEEPGVGANQPLQGGGETGPVDPDDTVRMASDGFTYPAVADVIQVTLSSTGGNEFTLRIENVSDDNTLALPGGGSTSVPLTPGVLVLHSDDDPLFTAGMAASADGLEALAEAGNPTILADALAARSGMSTPFAPGVFAVHESGMPLFTEGAMNGGLGMEALAEDGDPSVLAAHVDGLTGVSASGAFTVPVGAMDPGVIAPGGSYSFEFAASPGARLSLATMFVQSNDLFAAFSDDGLALFDADDMAVTGDVSAALMLWDAGSEANQWPGAGPDQAPRQAGADTGAADPDDEVRVVSDPYSYPAIGDLLRVSITVAD